MIVLDTWRLGGAIPGLELVAVDHERVVGHIIGARSQTGSPDVVAIAPLCVEPSRQGQGVGATLITALLDQAERQHWPGWSLSETLSITAGLGSSRRGDEGSYTRWWEKTAPTSSAPATLGV